MTYIDTNYPIQSVPNYIVTQSASKIPVKQVTLSALGQKDLWGTMEASKAYAMPNIGVGYKKTGITSHPIYGIIHKYQLNNGQKVFVIPKNDVKYVAFGTAVDASIRNEDETNNGVSHFLEHLLFKGSKQYTTREQTRLLEQNGAIINAFTSQNFTFYHVTGPSQNFKNLLSVHADMIKNPLIPEKELEKERAVVVEEIHMYQDIPERTHRELVDSKLFKGSKYERTIAGTPEIIQTISRDAILDYYHRLYAPDNRTTLIVGDVNPDEAMKLVAKNFNDINKLKVNKVLDVGIPQPVGVDEIHQSAQLKDIGLMTYAALGPAPDHPKDYISSVLLSIILGGKKSSRLNLDLKENKKIVSKISSEYEGLKDIGAFYINAEVEQKKLNPQDLAKIKGTIKEHIEAISKTPPTHEELNTAKFLIKKRYLSSSESINNVLNDVAQEYELLKNVDNVGIFLKLLDEVTAQDISQAAQKYLSQTPTIITTIPANTQSQKVSFKGCLEASDQVSHLNNGIELVTRNKNTNKTIGMTVAIKGGAKQTAYGELNLLAIMFGRGTQHKTQEQFSKYLEDNGISLSISPDKDSLLITASSLPEKQTHMYNILSEMLNEPLFNKTDFETQKNILRDNIYSNVKSNPKAMVQELLINSIYDNKDSRGSTDLKVLNNLNNIDVDKIKGLHHQILDPKNIEISVVGPNLDHAFIQKYLESGLGHFNTQSSAKTFNPIEIKQSKTLLYPTEANQAHISYGWVAPTLGNDDRYAFAVLKEVLSGGLSSRLFREFREERKGLAYTAHADLDSWVDDGLFTFYVGTQPHNIKLSMDLFRGQIDKLLAKNVSEEELAKAKATLKTKAELITKQSSVNISHELSQHRVLGVNTINDDLQNINQITADDIHRVAEKYLTKPYITVVAAPEQALKAVEQ